MKESGMTTTRLPWYIQRVVTRGGCSVHYWASQVHSAVGSIIIASLKFTNF